MTAYSRQKTASRGMICGAKRGRKSVSRSKRSLIARLCSSKHLPQRPICSREMERDFEGFSKAVRLVMAGRRKRCAFGRAWPVSKLIRVEDGTQRRSKPRLARQCRISWSTMKAAARRQSGCSSAETAAGRHSCPFPRSRAGGSPSRNWCRCRAMSA